MIYTEIKSSDKLIKNKFFELLSGKSFENKSFTDLAPFLLFTVFVSLFTLIIHIELSATLGTSLILRQSLRT